MTINCHKCGEDQILNPDVMKLTEALIDASNRIIELSLILDQTLDEQRSIRRE